MNSNILIENLIEGNESAYAYIMDEYYTRLCIYAQGLTKDKFKAEDIVQNVFFKVWHKRKKLSFDISIKNYLYKAVYNEFIDQYRRSRIMSPLEEEHIKHLNSIVEEQDYTEINRLIEVVKKEISNLPPKCKTIFTMAKLEGLTYNEIAEHQNISVRTVENQMYKAFEIIRQKVGDKMEGILFLLFKLNPKTNY
ncbi:RNA polymerase sigma factor [Aestuariibaculum suncheonense]|nr:RNA polymerase sigma-70 factor [Aestuariibaculum suncheonense]